VVLESGPIVFFFERGGTGDQAAGEKGEGAAWFAPTPANRTQGKTQILFAKVAEKAVEDEEKLPKRGAASAPLLSIEIIEQGEKRSKKDGPFEKETREKMVFFGPCTDATNKGNTPRPSAK